MNFKNFLLNKNVKITLLIYYIAFSVFAVSCWLERSTLFVAPDWFISIFAPIISSILFLLKFLLDEHSKKEFLICLLIVILVVALKFATSIPTVFVVSCFAFISMKDVDIKRLIKIDLVIKAFFFLTHTIVFAADYFTGIEGVDELVKYYVKGTSATLYFTNPNTAGLLGTWIALDLLYLKDDKRFKDFVFPTIIVVVSYLLTASRTPFFVYIIYLILQLIKNSTILTILVRIFFPLLAVLCFVMVNFLNTNNALVGSLNILMSDRIAYSINAYKMTGITFLPSVSAFSLLGGRYVLDVFYVSCFIKYGLITLAIYYLPYLLLPKESDNETKRFAIIASIYLLFEDAIAIVGLAIPYLIIADAYFNKKKFINEDGDEQ